MRLGLVGCSAGKKAGLWPAEQLYNSRLFQGRRAWVLATCDDWYILSAKHGLLHPQDPVYSYNLSLHHLNARARREWSRNVLHQLLCQDIPWRHAKVELHAGHMYLEHGLRDGLRELGAVLVEPAQGLGIGQQLALYRRGPNR